MQWLPISEPEMSTEIDVIMGQIINMRQSEKISKAISKTMTISLIAVQRIMKNWKNNRMKKNCRRKTILSDSFVTWQK